MASKPVIDFDFFDDTPSAGDGSSATFTKKVFHDNVDDQSKSDESSSISSNSDYETTDHSQSDLHGTNGNVNQSSHQSDQTSTLKSSSRSTSYSSGSSLHSQSQESDSEGHCENDVARSLTNGVEVKKNPTKRKPKLVKVFSSSSQNGDSSDSVTDVSPLTSPESSPSLQQFRKSSQNSEYNPGQVRHITKLNVTFTGSNNAKKATQLHRSKDVTHRNHEDVQNDISNLYSGGSYAWSSDSDDEAEINNVLMNRDQSNAGGKNKKQTRLRQNYASTNHRQRLLDSAARGSMDVSSLLETVLEFEKQNGERKVQNDLDSRMNYRIGEKLLQGKQRKNMSFSNEQVRVIDRENRRLLKEITTRSRPSSASSVRSSASVKSNASRTSSKSSLSRPSSSRRPESAKPCKLYHTALNRIQQQRQIERENMQILKRLQTAKPTGGLQRQRLLADHKRQSDYMGTSLDRNGMSLRKAQELTRNAEVVQRAIGVQKNKVRPVRPAWQDSW